MIPQIILASNSPRRRELLAMMGLPFEVIVSDCDETVTEDLTPDALVRELASRKAAAVADTLDRPGDFVVIGADTIVWDNGSALGKPKDAADARATVLQLSGHAHSVYTGVALIGRINGEMKRISDAVETQVVFGEISPEDADWYVSTGEPMDKAGSYGIQGKAGVFITGLHGDYYNVVGLPIARLRTMLADAFGIRMSSFAGGQTCQ